MNPELPCIADSKKPREKLTPDERLKELHSVVVGLIKCVESLTSAQKDTIALIDQLDLRLTKLKERVSFSCGENLYKIKYLEVPKD